MIWTGVCFPTCARGKTKHTPSLSSGGREPSGCSRLRYKLAKNRKIAVKCALIARPESYHDRRVVMSSSGESPADRAAQRRSVGGKKNPKPPVRTRGLLQRRCALTLSWNLPSSISLCEILNTDASKFPSVASIYHPYKQNKSTNYAHRQERAGRGKSSQYLYIYIYIFILTPQVSFWQLLSSCNKKHKKKKKPHWMTARCVRYSSGLEKKTHKTNKKRRAPDVGLFSRGSSPPGAYLPSETQPGWTVRSTTRSSGLTLRLPAQAGALLNHSLQSDRGKRALTGRARVCVCDIRGNQSCIFFLKKKTKSQVQRITGLMRL